MSPPEMLKMQKDTSNQIHYETFSKKHDIKRKVHRQKKLAKDTCGRKMKSIITTPLLNS